MNNKKKLNKVNFVYIFYFSILSGTFFFSSLSTHTCVHIFFSLSHIQFVASRRAKMNEWSVGFRKLGTCASFLIFFSPWLFFFLPQDRLHSGDHPRGIIKNPTTKPTVKFISTVAVRSINEFFFLHFFFFFLSLLCNLVSCFFFFASPCLLHPLINVTIPNFFIPLFWTRKNYIPYKINLILYIYYCVTINTGV